MPWWGWLLVGWFSAQVVVFFVLYRIGRKRRAEREAAMYPAVPDYVPAEWDRAS